MPDHQQHILLVGAGLAGSLLSIYLARRGYAVDVYERRPDMRLAHMSAGRSINLALSKRGIHALDEVGLLDAIMDIAIPMRGRMIHGENSSLTFQPYGKDDSEVIYSVSRGDLNRKLMDLAESHTHVRIHFQQRCDGMDFAKRAVHFTDEETGASYMRSEDTVIATDGAGSPVRQSMEATPRFNFSQEFLEHGYKELSIPPGRDGGFQLEKHALHIWPRHSFMLIALPNPDGSFTCTLFLQQEGDPGFSSLDTPAGVRAFFEREFPDALALMPTLEDDFFSNPTGALGTIRCFPWHVGDAAALLGDACHAVVPFYGQGMNCAFEDCTVLNECLDEFGTDWHRVFAAYQERRKINADAIADLALENFIEMRDRVADPHFLLMKKVGLVLEEKFPEYFIPKYSMVTFHRTPYAVARRRGQIQQEILEELTRGIEKIEDVHFALAEQRISTRLRPYTEEAGSLR
ncbi:MAG: FAD-dependent monooxygenase [Bacteroidetes bacterium]|nr:FAD-dependent monooxygenase [Bacteroidota bacterium]